MNVFYMDNSNHMGKYSGANTIIVANDEIANPVLQAPFKGAAGGEYVVLFRTIEHLIGSINKADERRRILLFCVKRQKMSPDLLREESVLMKSTSVICIIIPNGNKLTKMFPLVRWIFRPLNAFN